MLPIFFDFQRPNPTTWFYFSAILVVAMLFRFNKVFCLRNLDLITLYGPMPGYLLLVSRSGSGEISQTLGYGILVGWSIYFVFRCLVDMGLEYRPSHIANLNTAGLSWLCIALFISLVGISLVPPEENSIGPGISKFPVEKIRAHGDFAIGVKASESLSQVRLWTERGLSLACHLGIVSGLILVTWRFFVNWESGMAAAACHLVLPYSFLLTPHNEWGIGRWEDPWLMVLLLHAIFFCRKPMTAGFCVGIAIGSLIFPLVVLTAWIGFFRGRERYRFLVGVLSMSLGTLCLVLMGGLVEPWRLSPDWLPWNEPLATSRSIWHSVPWAWAYRLPVFILHGILIVLALFWPQPKHIGHLIAQNTLLLACTQWWLGDKGGAHILWYLPMFLLLVFRPSLAGGDPDYDFLKFEKRIIAKFQRWCNSKRLWLLRIF